MAKSLGNFVTMGDVLARNDPEAFRYFLLNAHYRGGVGFDVEKKDNGRVVFPLVDDAERRVEYLYTTLEALETTVRLGTTAGAGDEPQLAPFAKAIASARERVLAALDKDLNTPAALAVLGEVGKAANEIVVFTAKAKMDPKKAASGRKLAAAARDALVDAAGLLGLLPLAPSVFFERTREQRLKNRGLEASAIEARLAERTAARASKDFALGDRIRRELEVLGVVVLDSPEATTWKVSI
jgi:cysteinyl-tRNA synthetase